MGGTCLTHKSFRRSRIHLICFSSIQQVKAPPKRMHYIIALNLSHQKLTHCQWPGGLKCQTYIQQVGVQFPNKDTDGDRNDIQPYIASCQRACLSVDEVPLPLNSDVSSQDHRVIVCTTMLFKNTHTASALIKLSILDLRGTHTHTLLSSYFCSCVSKAIIITSFLFVITFSTYFQVSCRL